MVGVLMMIGVTYILFQDYKSFFANLAIVLLEPGGWFMFWEGLDLAIFEKNKRQPDLDFYNKMAQCEINFLSY